MRAAVILVSVAVSGCAYKAGSFAHPRANFTGERVSIGCLDFAVERRPNLPEGGTVLGYSFGNRCNSPATIDLAQAHVEGRTYDGVTRRLAPYDPENEIRPMMLDGRSAGSEAIAYHSDERLAEVCVDVASVVREREPRWLCFASNLPPPTVAEVTR